MPAYLNVRHLPGLVAALALMACGVLPKGAPNFTLHDLGPLPAASERSVGLAIRSVEVVPAPWLASTAMQYRLAYVQVTERQAYMNSRWAAQPGQLLEVLLRRALRAKAAGGKVSGCRLRVDLDEFVQVFDGQSASRGVIDVRAALLAPRTDQLLAVKGFSIALAAPSADAEGGVAALRDGVAKLDEEVLAWLDGLAPDSPGARCES
jgi:cholesterol transport system auxiliary component